MYQDDFLQLSLNERIANDALRALRLPEGKVDFCSNDYLGIATNRLIGTEATGFHPGSAGSRLLAGNTALAELAEKEIAAFHHADAALLFNSGYDANLGLLSSVPKKGDTVIYDQLSHASIRDGIRLSFAHSFSFIHNDTADLEKKLQHASGNLFVVTESVFSMDGDTCPLEEIIALCERYGAHLMVDEAHATGIIGEKGAGLVQLHGLEEKVFARVHTFGKACGCHGAVVLGSKRLRSYLVNFARSLIYSTALPEHALETIRESYRLFPSMASERKKLNELIGLFHDLPFNCEVLPSATPIQALVIPGNDAVRKAAAALQAGGLDIRPILYPTVPRNRERLRIILHAFNRAEDVKRIAELLHTV
ncbi:aminotransferase class I/II-fold pyridoxal phosphate-dependent enzyme [Sediminibacterium ginsengisoli]|uniref:8-amino-7-oxononanoate synthase n=1 Tax=Sediminibacterium ginsengisoli TaxID=413434 RepID=A0A1T4L885_9BACT|nr:pyridoxal phosphate-dependent aminotransferase family protein [Sediminibacterium ginsengisoli]SJZ50965.1 8-amino-7-oxononanoate synthase [Sediminibacterium ginsengisoli]